MGTFDLKLRRLRECWCQAGGAPDKLRAQSGNKPHLSFVFPSKILAQEKTDLLKRDAVRFLMMK
jgi:hypothetical protein